MTVFKNENNLPLPIEEEVLKRVEEYKKLYDEVEDIAERIDVANKLVEELEEKLEAVEKVKEKCHKDIAVYNVKIKHIDDDACHLFTLLDEALEFKTSLLAAGIRPDDVDIVLTNEWADVDDINMHREPDLYGFHYDPKSKYNEYRCKANQENRHKKQKLDAANE